MPSPKDGNARAKLSEEAKIFNSKVDGFIEAVENDIYPVPSDYNLIQYLGIEPKRLRYYKDHIDQHGYRDGFEKLKLYRESFWSNMSLDQRKATSAIFHLKQPQNGGYQDKQDKSTDPIKVEVVIKGCEGAFK